ncbi:MAG TPA: hypothetical protein PLU39_13515 [Armatimonadota bacterium]|nr:hypothetical protein [Armatimonadota bacterium]HOM81902.1 hypothetical protein [Armatimonadota bacterium]HPO71888.1 hypothetical protein [Armatimonadota bacterium]HPT98880.1 hypothetical protein [Armatimonadota bacterium]
MCEQPATTKCDRLCGHAEARRDTALAAGVALAISAAASPYVVLPGFAFVLTWHYSPDWHHFLAWAGIAVFFSTGIPFLYILLGTRSGRITDIHVMRREQRRGPFLVSLISSAAGTVLLHLISAPRPLVALGVAIIANGIVFAAITHRWKISMHLSVYTAAVLAASVLLTRQSLWLLAFLPAVIWARTKRTRHSVSQGVAAVIVSAMVTLGVLAFFGYLPFV